MTLAPFLPEEDTRFAAIEVGSSATLAASIAANASAIVVLQASTAANASAIVVLEAGEGHPADLFAFNKGTLVAGSAFWLWPVTQSTSIPTQSALNTAIARVASDGSNIDISLKHSGNGGGGASTIGTVKFVGVTASGLVDVSSAVVMVPGDFLLASNLNVDTATQDVSFVIKATTT